MVVETALDWFRRSSSECNEHHHQRDTGSSNDDESATVNVSTATDAAWRFLRYGKSGIAPIDVVWKRCRNDERHKRLRKYRYQPVHVQEYPCPPVVVIEGPKDTGKTWMLLTLTARYVVETRASRFDNVDTDGNEDSISSEDRPKVLLLDSSYGFSISQLVHVVQQRLRIVKQRQQQLFVNDNVDHNDGQNREQQQQYQHQHRQQNKSSEERQFEEELERQERGKLSFERDMEDCLSRIHIIQVDDGSTGWIPILEALTYRLSENRCRNSSSNDNLRRETDSSSFPPSPPTLLLWDGFISDLAVANNTITASTTSGSIIDITNNRSSSNNAHENALFDSPVSRELLRQVSRLLEKERDTLWWVLTTRTSSSTTKKAFTLTNSIGNPSTRRYGSSLVKNFGIGFRVTEWIRKEEERREQQQEERERQQLQQRNHTGFVQPKQLQHQQKQLRRSTYRVQLDRHCSSLSATTVGVGLFARIIGTSAEYNKTNNYTSDVDGGEIIPFSLSLEGILS